MAALAAALFALASPLLEAARRAIGPADADGDNMLNEAEFGVAFARDKGLQDAVFKVFDGDGDGRLDQEPFVSLERRHCCVCRKHFTQGKGTCEIKKVSLGRTCMKACVKLGLLLEKSAKCNDGNSRDGCELVEPHDSGPNILTPDSWHERYGGLLDEDGVPLLIVQLWEKFRLLTNTYQTQGIGRLAAGEKNMKPMEAFMDAGVGSLAALGEEKAKAAIGKAIDAAVGGEWKIVWSGMQRWYKAFPVKVLDRAMADMSTVLEGVTPVPPYDELKKQVSKPTEDYAAALFKALPDKVKQPGYLEGLAMTDPEATMLAATIFLFHKAKTILEATKGMQGMVQRPDMLRFLATWLFESDKAAVDSGGDEVDPAARMQLILQAQKAEVVDLEKKKALIEACLIAYDPSTPDARGFLTVTAKGGNDLERAQLLDGGRNQVRPVSRRAFPWSGPTPLGSEDTSEEED